MKKINYLLFTFLMIFIGCEKEEENTGSSIAIQPVASFSSNQLGQDLDSRYTWLCLN